MSRGGKHLGRNLDGGNSAPENRRDTRYEQQSYRSDHQVHRSRPQDYQEDPRQVYAKRTQKAKPKKSKKKTALKAFLITILVLILIAVLLVFFVLGSIKKAGKSIFADPSEETYETDENATGNTVDPDSVSWADVDTIKGEGVYNILLIGQDRREDEGRQRSDSMILCSINTKTGKVHVVSFMRDLYVQIPGYEDNRINAAYELGGMELLDDTIKKNFGITIDGNVEVDFDEFAEIIDIFGGVDIDLTEAEAEYVNEDNESGSDGELTEGVNHLSGTEALAYARCRHLDSDFERTGRQRNVLLALAAEARDMSLKEVMAIITQVFPDITTDLSNTEIISYAAKVMPIIADSSNIVTGRVPQDGQYEDATIREMAVLVPDLEASSEYLEDLLYGTADTSETDASATAFVSGNATETKPTYTPAISAA